MSQRRLAVALASIAIAVPARAQVLTFTDDQLVVVASASPDTTFVGGIENETISIDQSTGDFGGPGMSDGLIRFLDFAVSPLAEVRSATLDFDTTSFSNGPVGVYQMTTDWDTTTTWNSLGGDGLTIGVETTPVALDSLSDLEENVLARFDVTQAVAAWAAGDAPYLGFGIRNESTDGWDFQTADVEGRSAPVLTVEIEVPSPIKLEIDRATGFGRLVSVADGFDVELRGYELLSATEAFTASEWELTNLSAQRVDAIDAETAGDRWDSVNGATDQLYEAYLNGFSLFSPGESRSLGRIVRPGTDPVLAATVLTTNFLGGNDPFNTFSNVIVEYVDFPSLPGDFNDDGFVDAVDYTVWRDGGLGDLLESDYATWRLNYGVGSQNTPPATTPEPDAILLLACIGMGPLRPRHA